MIVLPAVDIKNGKAVRLKQGRANAETVFSPDPVAAARAWEEQGARYLHVVDLDGAFDGAPKSRDIVKGICQTLSIPVELGGGIRDMETARAYLDCGVTRLIIGTMAIENLPLFRKLCEAFPGRIGVSLDAGASFVVYTDIERDGMQSGVNVEALKHLCEICSVPVLAAGGVATLDDVKRLYPLSVDGGLEGAISGRALYEKTLDLKEANAWIAAQQA